MCNIFASQDPHNYASETRAVRLHGHCTSIRLEVGFWDVLERIAAQEGTSSPASARRCMTRCWRGAARSATSPRFSV